MRNRLLSTIMAAIVAGSATMALTGCDEQLHKDIADFNDAVTEASTGITDLYSHVNGLYRRYYFEDLRFHPGTVIPNDVDKAPDVYGHYPSDYIQARLLAFQALASYSGALNLLASSSAPKDAEAAIEATGDKLGKLNDQLNTLNKKNPNLALSKFSTPIAHIVALCTGGILEFIRNKKLKQSLEDSKTEVATLCNELKKDVAEVAAAEQARANKIAALYRTYYSDTDYKAKLLDGKITDTERVEFIASMRKMFDDVDALNQNDPAALIDAIQTAHDTAIEHLEGNDAKSQNSFAASVELRLANFRLRAHEFAHGINHLASK